MNGEEKRYTNFALVREMLETPSIIKNLPVKKPEKLLDSLKETGRLFITGEGSSRIFPAKNAVFTALRKNHPLLIHTESGRQAAELDLRGYALLGISHSGRTKEVITLFKQRKAHSKFALTANTRTLLKKWCNDTFILSCGDEEAVSATKSVIEQGLFCQNLLLEFLYKKIQKNTFNELSKKAAKLLEMNIDRDIISKLAKSPVLYFAGRNNGVAEEATLKTNEITRKKAVYLEGTYAMHGVEESMEDKESVIIIDPFKEEESKFNEVLVEGVGMNVIAISSHKTSFPTIKIPQMQDYDSYLQLMMCWNLLVEVGITLGINLDRPVRARKIGNEYLNSNK